MLLRLSRGGASALIAGSRHPGWQAEVLDRREDVAAAGLIATGAEGDPAWTPDWLAAVRPSYLAQPSALDDGRVQVTEPDRAALVLDDDHTLRWTLDPVLGLQTKGITRWR